ncbi:MAG: DUF3987 domain-containing protein [Burkholderiaceae bacterium]
MKLFCSIALILHLAEGSIGPVQAHSALRAAAWCEYLTGHARRVYGLIEAARITTARMVSRRLTERKLGKRFTKQRLKPEAMGRHHHHHASRGRAGHPRRSPPYSKL